MEEVITLPCVELVELTAHRVQLGQPLHQKCGDGCTSLMMRMEQEPKQV
jgi:hypothetical protein